jgi:hypothetical protein
MASSDGLLMVGQKMKKKINRELNARFDIYRERSLPILDITGDRGDS